MIAVKKISWERTNIILKLNKEITEKSYFINERQQKIELNTNKDEIKISLINTPEGEMIESGKWHVEIPNKILKINTNILNNLDDLSRVFKYRNGFYSLQITFEINEKNELYIDVSYMMKNQKYKKFYRLQEGKTLKKKTIIIFKIITIKLINIFYKILYKLNRTKKILILSENSNFLQGNLKEVYESIKDNYDVITYTKDIYKNRNNIISIFNELLFISRAKYIILDNYNSLLTILNVSKEQKIIQVWHAGVGFKAVGYARFGKPGSPHPFISSHRKYNYAIVDKKELIDIYKEVYGCSENIFIVGGMPRLNNYLNENRIKEVKNNLYKEINVLKGKKIILFSPTYRGTGSRNAYYDYEQIDLDKINNFCQKNNFIFVIKMHPFIKERIIIKEDYKKNIIDLSNYEINDLIYITDIMITDYSSCAYEYSLFNRPLIFYRYDKQLYEYIRPMHTLDMFVDKQYEVESFEELINTLENLKNIKNNVETNTFVKSPKKSYNTIHQILKGEKK